MKPELARDILSRLETEGYVPTYVEGELVNQAPNGSIAFDLVYLEALKVSAFFDAMVTRREQLERMFEAAPDHQKLNLRASIEDVAIAIDVVGALIDRMLDPR